MKEERGTYEPERLLTAQELADYLEIPLGTIYAWRYRREGPPGFRVGRYLRYRWRDVEGWIDDQVAEANSARL